MKSIRGRLAALEAAASRGLENRQLGLFCGAMAGDPLAVTEFEKLRGAVTGRLHELYDAIWQPVEGQRQSSSKPSPLDRERPWTDLDLERPEA